jgi:hypothetical protein
MTEKIRNRAPFRKTHPVEHVTDLYLLPVGAALITEPLNINNDDGPVDSQPSIHVLSR